MTHGSHVPGTGREGLGGLVALVVEAGADNATVRIFDDRDEGIRAKLQSKL